MTNTKDEIRTLMDDAAGALLGFCKQALEKGAGDLSSSVIFVRRENRSFVLISLVDRAAFAAKPPPDLIPPQLDALRNGRGPDEIVVLLFTRTARGVGRITKSQIEAGFAKTGGDA